MFLTKIIAAAGQVIQLLDQINEQLKDIYGNNSKGHKDKLTQILSVLAMQRYSFDNLHLLAEDKAFLDNLLSFNDLFFLKNGVADEIRPNWDEYFMGFAINAAMRSSCHGRKVGAVIVRDNQLQTSGYNGADKNNKSCKEANHCRKEDKKREISAQNPNLRKYKIGQNIINASSNNSCVSECAESTAISHIKQYEIKTGDNCSIYSTLFPCESCAAKIIKAGYIKKVFYKSDYNNKTRTDKNHKQTLQLFKQHGIVVQKLRIRPQVMQMMVFNLLHPDGVSHELTKPNEFDSEMYESYELTDIGCDNC